jgi:FkbM family methyltransferase
MSLETLLTELLAEPVEAARVRSELEFDRIAAPFERRVVILGTGHLGKLALSGLRGAGIEPLAFCDNNARLWAAETDGVPILSPAEAVERYGDSAAFVVAIYNSSAPRAQLRQMGCARVVPYPVLFWKHWRTMPKEDRLELPHRILARAGEMAAGYDLLSDEQSRREFCAQIRWRCLLDYTCLPPPEDPPGMYFPALFDLSPREVFVDCGAYDGDTIRAFLNAARRNVSLGDGFHRIYAWEADAVNCGALQRYCAGLPSPVGARIEILSYAVGARDETVRFCAEGSVGSRFADSGATVEVQCKTIDSLLEDAAPTFIKMDIEGAEPDALRGASRTMGRYAPVMAVCAYHKCEHLWEIPQLLKASNPGYRIFLRRYAEDCWETVYYAVPPARWKTTPKAAHS